MLLQKKALTETLSQIGKKSSFFPDKSLIRLKPTMLKYINKHVDPLQTSIQKVSHPTTHEKIKEIKEILKLVDRNSLSPDKQELISSSVELWSKLIAQTYTTNEKSERGQRSKQILSIENIPKEIFHVLLNLAKAGRKKSISWNGFDLFWMPIAGSPLALEIAPELIIRASFTSPRLAFDILMRIASEPFFTIQGQSVSQKAFIKSRYTQSIMCALNAFLYSLMQAKYLEHPSNISKYWNLMYEVFDQLNRSITHITLFPKVAQTLTQRIPRRAFADFYAIFLLRNVNIQNTHLRPLTDQLLSNGSDAEKSLVLNADKLLAANKTNLKPAFSLSTYKSILKHLGRNPSEADNNMATWLLDKIVTKYASQPANLPMVLNTILRHAADSGNMTEAASIYEYMIQKDGIEPDITTYSNLFRGFRHLAPTLGDHRCFEVLSLIHQKGLDIPSFLCTEILTLINEWYHGQIVYGFYQAYFGQEFLQDLGIAEFFDGLYVPDIEKPEYTPRIQPDTVTSTPEQPHEFSPVALSILYSATLRSVSTISQVADLYKKFRGFSGFPCDQSHLYSVYDRFISTLCKKFKTYESLSLAKSILDEMVEAILASSPTPNIKSLYSQDQSLQSVRKPYRYTGTQLKCFAILIKVYCERGNVARAREVLDLGLSVSPFVHGNMFEPIIQYYLARQDLSMALKWMDNAHSVGAYITNNDEMVQTVENYRQELNYEQAQLQDAAAVSNVKFAPKRKVI